MLPIETIKEFLSSYENQSTVRTYRRALRLFRSNYRTISEGQFFEVHLIPKALNIHFKNLHAEKKAKSTIANQINVLQKYFDWAIQQGFLEKNPMDGIERVRISFSDFTPAFVPENFSPENFLSRPDQNTFRGNNARLIIFLLSAFGLRRSEILQLKRGDILGLESDEPKLIIRSNREFGTRVYKLEESSVEELKCFLIRRDILTYYKLNDDDYVLQINPLVKNVKPVDGSTIYRTLNRYLITEDEKKMSPSSFRLGLSMGQIYSKKYFEISSMYGISHKEIAMYKVLDAKKRLEKESKELIEEIVQERLKAELKKLTG